MSDSHETHVDNKGAIHIAEDVVASIAALSASEVDGVGALVAGTGVDISEFLGKKNLAKGVKLLVADGNVTTDIFLLVKYGYSVQSVAQKVQESVASSIESMTGLNSIAVNVHVTGICFDKDSKKPEKI